jgi:hypothetical protein
MNLCRIIPAVICLCIPSYVQSQISTGVIQGVVRDSTGGVLPETLITARHIEVGTSRTCRTSTEGFFTAALLPAGTYEITAQRTSFADIRIIGIEVNVGQTRSIEVIMKPSAIAEFIEIQDKAPITNPSQYEISSVIDQSEIEALPLNGRRSHTRNMSAGN